ncbi:MAG: hypothetical protein AB7W16_11345 [Candidatus Obscuribacterales bacterium]
MNGSQEKVLKEIEELCAIGRSNVQNLPDNDTWFFDATRFYQPWYTRALPIVRLLLPDRVTEFRDYYRPEKRAKLTFDNYSISDALLGTKLSPKQDPTVIFLMLFNSQIAILESAGLRISDVLSEVKTEIRREVFDSDIDSAKKLLRGNHFRAAGAVCGVVIEKHLSLLCKAHGVTVVKKDPAIGDLALALKEAVITQQTFHRLNHLGSLRNLCCHNKGREPIKEEVQDLISGTEAILDTIS